jgi:hypothetical protein
MAANAGLTLIINAIPSNERYRNYFKGLVQPIFLLGDSITGQVGVAAVKGEGPSKRNIIVRLSGKFTAVDGDLHTFIVQELQLSTDSLTTTEFLAPFTFDKPVISFPSYHGVKCSLVYQLTIEVKTGWFRKKASKSETIVIFDPTKSLSKIPPPVPIRVEWPPVYFQVAPERGHFFTTDHIKGVIQTPTTVTPVQSASLRLVLTERWGEGSQFRSEDTILMNYELLDGPPRPSATIPFVMQLSQLELWVAKSTVASKITVSYRLDVMLMIDGVVKQAGSERITLLQPFAAP